MEGFDAAVRKLRLEKGASTYRTFGWFLTGFAQLVDREKCERAAVNRRRGRNGEHMNKTLLLASFLLLAGAAHGQGIASPGGSLNGAAGLNSAGSLGSGGGLNGRGSINTPAASSPASPSAPGAAVDRNVNQNSKNPGEYVPSRFTNYGDAVALGVLESGVQPLTVAEAARQAQMQKKNAEPKPVIVLDKDDEGKLVIAPASKK